jgi:hypothetical protein
VSAEADLPLARFFVVSWCSPRANPPAGVIFVFEDFFEKKTKILVVIL